MCSSFRNTLARAELRYWKDWTDAVARCGDVDTRVVRFGRIAGAFVAGVPCGQSNRLLGMTGNDVDDVGRALAWYRQRSCPPRVDVDDVHPGRGVAVDALGRSGYVTTDRWVTLFSHLNKRIEESRSSILVRPVATSSAARFAAFHDRAYHGASDPHLATFRRSAIEARMGPGPWHPLVAMIDGAWAAAAFLHVADGVATLCGAATDPRFRGKGCQRALIEARLLIAQELGCRLVVSRCRSGSASARNLIHSGAVVAYSRSVWRSEPTADEASPTAA